MRFKNPFKIKILEKYIAIFKESGFKGLIKEGAGNSYFSFLCII